MKMTSDNSAQMFTEIVERGELIQPSVVWTSACYLSNVPNVQAWFSIGITNAFTLGIGNNFLDVMFSMKNFMMYIDKNC